jgi:hypothetical protein
MLHPVLTQALATAHIEDQVRAAARWHAVPRARRVARESRVAPTSTAGQRSTSTPPMCTPRAQAPRHEWNRDGSPEAVPASTRASMSFGRRPGSSRRTEWTPDLEPSQANGLRKS